MLEMVFVMMGITMVTAGLLTQSLDIYHRYALMQTMHRVESSLILAKYKSMVNHRRVTLSFHEKHYEMEEMQSMDGEFRVKNNKDTHKSYLGNVTLAQPQVLTYNEHGRISQAATMVFQCHSYEQSIVIWLGQGVYEISKIRLRDD